MIEWIDIKFIMENLPYKKRKAYELIQQLNEERKELGLIVIRGKLPKKYFLEKVGV